MVYDVRSEFLETFTENRMWWRSALILYDVDQWRHLDILFVVSRKVASLWTNICLVCPDIVSKSFSEFCDFQEKKNCRLSWNLYFNSVFCLLTGALYTPALNKFRTSASWKQRASFTWCKYLCSQQWNFLLLYGDSLHGNVVAESGGPCHSLSMPDGMA